MVYRKNISNRARQEPGGRKLRGEGASTKSRVSRDHRGAGNPSHYGRDDGLKDPSGCGGHSVGGGGSGGRPDKCVSYRLPFPLSVNNLFFNAGRRGRVKTTRYQTWLREVGVALKQQGIAKVEGQVSIKLLIIRPDRRRRDLDNYIKCVLDALVLNGAMGDDSLVEKIVISWHSDNLGGCFVEIRSHAVCAAEDQTGVG